MTSAFKTRTRDPRAKSSRDGFALIVTLSLMILLAVVALGLLTLGTVEVRKTSRADAQAVARANARLALAMAIGELQAAAGPDQRITATSGILGDSALQTQLTGVWRSHRLEPDSGADDFSAEKKSASFVRWLVSGPDPGALQTTDFANSAPAADSVILVPEKKGEATAETIAAVRAARVPVVREGRATGSYAYAVLDEGVKARVNLGEKKFTGPLGTSSLALGSGQRPAADRLAGVPPLPDDVSLDLNTPAGRSFASKLVSVSTAEIGFEMDRGKLTDRFHDVTTSSSGVLSDAANGGLKTDLNLLAQRLNEPGGTLPPDFAGRGVYEKAFPGTTIPSDPPWSRVLEWANLFNQPGVISTATGNGVPTALARRPEAWVAGTGVKRGSAELSEKETPGAVLLPAIAKIQVSFALSARDVYQYNSFPPPAWKVPKEAGNMHGPWADKFRKDKNKNNAEFDSPYDFLLHLVYSPVITLHNPYNVPLSFEKLRVEFINVPFAFEVFVNGKSNTKSPVPFSRMYGNSTGGGRTKRFGLFLTDTLLPGEVKVYSPDIPPGRTWRAEVKGGSSNFVFWDWGNQNKEDDNSGATATDTSRANGIPGWNGPAVGYDLDFLCPGDTRISSDLTLTSGEKIDRWEGIPLKAGDEVYVESSPILDPKLEKRFSVEMTLAGDIETRERSAAFLFEFGDAEEFSKALLRPYSKVSGQTTNVIRAPGDSDTWLTRQLVDHQLTALADMKNVQPFALFSASAKTTSDGNADEVLDGVLPAKPFSFENNSAPVTRQKVDSLPPGQLSHQLALTPYPDSLSVFGFQPGTSRARFITGQTSSTGRYFGTNYEIPLAPPQNFTTLNAAGPAAGRQLPRFTAPLGNSFAHPLIAPEKITAPGPAGYDYPDHSFLLNAAFYDSYYFSGLQNHGSSTAGGDGKTAVELAAGFVDSASPGATGPSPLPDPRLKLFLPDGTTPDLAKAALAQPEAYQKAAAHQLVEGSFNVNSVSVQAWKAVLASMSGNGAVILENPASHDSADITVTEVTLPPATDPKGARFSRFRLPNGEPDRTDPDGFWRGGIDLDEAQLEDLATEIVRQVEKRGPFLSLAEFVNRRVGTDPETSLRGALQQAILDSEVNLGIADSADSGRTITAAAAADSELALAAPQAMEGEAAQGAPGFLLQSDLLAVLGNAVAVRSDTFVIRAYGEASSGETVTARAWCEATVQRTPDYLDPADPAATPIAGLAPGGANETFGRRFRLVSFRWLSPEEF